MTKQRLQFSNKNIFSWKETLRDVLLLCAAGPGTARSGGTDESGKAHRSLQNKTILLQGTGGRAWRTGATGNSSGSAAVGESAWKAQGWKELWFLCSASSSRFLSSLPSFISRHFSCSFVPTGSAEELINANRRATPTRPCQPGPSLLSPRLGEEKKPKQQNYLGSSRKTTTFYPVRAAGFRFNSTATIQLCWAQTHPGIHQKLPKAAPTSLQAQSKAVCLPPAAQLLLSARAKQATGQAQGQEHITHKQLLQESHLGFARFRKERDSKGAFSISSLFKFKPLQTPASAQHMI